MKARDGNLLQLIWGYFVSNKLEPIDFILGSVKQDLYIELLHINFKLFIEALARNKNINFEF